MTLGTTTRQPQLLKSVALRAAGYSSGSSTTWM